eukprot:Em0028g31a
MAALYLKIRIVTVNSDIIKTLEFDESMLVRDACAAIRERTGRDSTDHDGQGEQFGLLRPDENPSKGIWLDMGRALEYYGLKSGDMLEYRNKVRHLDVRTMDGHLHTLSVDDSLTVAELTKLFAESIGLPKYEEFSFTVDEETVERAMKRQSLHAMFSKFERKLAMLNKKNSIITDDGVNWLNPDKTLREQDISVDTVVNLRKRLFFPEQDRAVDTITPVLLNTVYEECKAAIVKGTHPCTRDEAIHFAALQCVLTGCFRTEFQPGALNIRDHLPESYAALKGIDKLVWQRWQEQGQMTGVDAKQHYVQKCSSLPTYGITYFLVKGNVGGKKKKSHLLAIASTAISQVNTKGKDDIIKTWPLTIIKKYTASDDTFTLEFGEYQEPTYSVKTIQGDAIQQLIDGYINLTLKERRPQRPDTPEEEDVQIVDSINPRKAGKVSLLDDLHGDVASRQPPIQQMSLNTHMMAALQQLIKTIESAKQSIQQAPDDQQPIDDDPSPNEHISSLLANMLALTASIILCTQVDVLDPTSCSVVASAVTTISSNFSVLANAVRVLSNLPLGEHDLLPPTRALGNATVEVFIAAHPEEIENRQQLFAAGKKMADTGDHLLMLVNEQEIDEETHEALIRKTSAIPIAAIQLITVAKKIATLCQDQDVQNQVIMAAKELALTTQGLVACTKVLAPCVNKPVCEDQLLEACNHVLIAIEKILKACQATGISDEDILQALGPAATYITEALRDFMAKINEVTKAEVHRLEEQSANSLGVTKSFTQSMSKSVTRSIALYARVSDNMQETVDELTETLRNTGSLRPTSVSVLKSHPEPTLPPIAASPDPPSTLSSPTPPPSPTPPQPQPSSPPILQYEVSPSPERSLREPLLPMPGGTTAPPDHVCVSTHQPPLTVC